MFSEAAPGLCWCRRGRAAAARGACPAWQLGGCSDTGTGRALAVPKQEVSLLLRAINDLKSVIVVVIQGLHLSLGRGKLGTWDGPTLHTRGGCVGACHAEFDSPEPALLAGSRARHLAQIPLSLNSSPASARNRAGICPRQQLLLELCAKI